MNMNAESLLNFRRIMKLHEGILKKVCEEYQLTLTEASIICFLKNNPTLDTAGDIVEIRMLSKGNVSQAVESLIRKSLLQRTQDTDDRRKIHLSLLPGALPISSSIDTMQEEFMRELDVYKRQEKGLRSFCSLTSISATASPAPMWHA